MALKISFSLYMSNMRKSLPGGLSPLENITNPPDQEQCPVLAFRGPSLRNYLQVQMKNCQI